MLNPVCVYMRLLHSKCTLSHLVLSQCDTKCRHFGIICDAGVKIPTAHSLIGKSNIHGWIEPTDFIWILNGHNGCIPFSMAGAARAFVCSHIIPLGLIVSDGLGIRLDIMCAIELTQYISIFDWRRRRRGRDESSLIRKTKSQTITHNCVMDYSRQ